jgi:hypothetical protein
MATRKTLNLLPSIFQTETNKKFLGATLDQLVSEPDISKFNGFIGRKFSPVNKPSDNFINEPTVSRENYQFEPAVVIKNTSNGIDLYADYQDLLEKIANHGGITENHNRLFESEYYSFNPRINFDKFINYTRYFWLPTGTDPVTVSAGTPGNDRTFVITRNDPGGYATINQDSTPNSTITLVRGSIYKFNVNQPGSKFWIQTEVGIDGFKDFNQTISTRDIIGIENNGAESGTITFTVPDKDSQDYYFKMPSLGFIDYAISDPFSAIDGQFWVNGNNAMDQIEGSTQYPQGYYVVFTSTSTNPDNWIDYTGNPVPVDKRHGLWKITINQNSKIQMEFVRTIPLGHKIRINYGTNAGKEFFKNSGDNLVLSPPITAPLSTLFYQDENNESIVGKINIVDFPGNAINVNSDVLGKVTYTSPNGVVFTNGLTVVFDSTVFPNSYRNSKYIIEGVGKSIKLIDITLLESVESVDTKSSVPFDQEPFDTLGLDQPIANSVGTPDYIVMNKSTTDLNAWARGNRWFHEDIIAKAAEYNKTTVKIDPTKRANRPIIEFEEDLQLFNSGKNFLAIIDRADTNFVGTGEKILNAYTDVNDKYVNDTSIRRLNYIENQIAIFPNDISSNVRNALFRIEFKNQITATSFNGVGTGYVNIRQGSNRVYEKILDGNRTTFRDQFIPGTLLYAVDNTYIGKVKSIFSNNEMILEAPALVTRNEVVVKFNYPKITLRKIKTAVNNDSVVVRTGLNQKNTFWLNSGVWAYAQYKKDVNTPIKFDVVDKDGISLSSPSKYTESKFAGTTVFSYDIGSSIPDPILGIKLRYTGIGNSISDINFVNSFETDTFTYKPYDYKTLSISSIGYLSKRTGRNTYSLLTVWQSISEPTKQYQHIADLSDGTTNYFEIDILPSNIVNQPNIKVFVNNELIKNEDFVIETVGVRHAVNILTTVLDGDKIDILIYNKKSISDLGYYQIPSNLEFNAQNYDITNVTLGQLRGHWNAIGKNTIGLIGNPISSNNLRDLNTNAQNGLILQHSSPTIYASLFLIDPHLNFINSIEFARSDYSKFKNKFLELCVNTPGLPRNNIPIGVDMILKIINGVKNQTFPWHYSDMIPWGDDVVLDTYKIINAQTRLYTLNNIYLSSIGDKMYPKNGPSNCAVLVYLNNRLLVIDVEYTITNGNPYITISDSVLLYEGDILTIKGYKNTDGSYVPETPTKMGMYPKFVPSIFVDTAFRTPINVIQGHDGSRLPVFNDLRDDYLLELEKRIFNNIKVEYNAELFDVFTFVPGKFRNNDYTRLEFNEVLNSDFLKWIGTNQLDIGSNEYFLSNNEFSWNYNQASDSINDELLPGYWKGIYQYFYDTCRPHTHPWEMLGIQNKPVWWEPTYGGAPYTPSKTQMWADLAYGFNRGDRTTNTQYSRPGLLKIIPVNDAGELLPPVSKLVKKYNGTTFNQSYAIGDQGPVESAWRNTSEYVFSLHRAIALLKPAKYFGLFFNTSSYIKDPVINQYVLKNNKKRITSESLLINGEVVSGAITRSSSYVNWMHGYLTNLGINAAQKIRTTISNLDIRLGYRMSGYSDKSYFTALVEQYSPNSVNQSAIIPSENYIVHLNKSSPIRSATYSGVIISKTTGGYVINGYNLKYPYFTVVPSLINGNFYRIEAVTATAIIYKDYIDQKINVPYGFEFGSSQELVDFLVGYERFLMSQGFIFEAYDSDLGEVKNWILSAKEFLGWTLQGWNEGNILVLSPVHYTLQLFSTDSVVDTVIGQTSNTQVLGPNFNVIKADEITVLKEPGRTTVTVISGQTIAFIELHLVQYEHVLVFDNTTVFNDVIYKPELGSRQYRLKLIGSKTTGWDGSLNIPGFIYNTGYIEQWTPGRDYKKADIIQYKKQNYTAIADISGTDTFKHDLWSITDRKIEAGLVPNFSQNASKFNTVYSLDTPNIDSYFSGFSNGLTGYRNRSYLEDLGMDQIAQTKFYQGYIKEKGTFSSISALFKARLDNTINNVEIFEEWGLRVGEYGATKTNQSIDLILDEKTFQDDPIVFSVINGIEIPPPNVKFFRPNTLLSKSIDFKSPLFSHRPMNEYFETDIKTAGYVNINDVDSLLFDFNNYKNLNLTILADLVNGYKLWVAKDFNKDWQVYKVIEVDNQVLGISYGLDNKVIITTKYDHGLQIADIIAIRDLNSLYDGFYQVLNVDAQNTFICIIATSLISSIQTVPVYGTGTLFLLQKSRYKTTELRESNVTKSIWQAGDLVWIDENNGPSWATYKFVSSDPGNFGGLHNFWGMDNGSIIFRSSGLPYHEFGNIQFDVTAVKQNYNRIWPLYAGKNVPATVASPVGSGIIGFCLNGVPIYSSIAADFTAPADYNTPGGFNYNLSFSDYNFFKIDDAGGTTTFSGEYFYRSFTFGQAWNTGIGGSDTRANVEYRSEILSIAYLGGGLAHSNSHSKILGFAIDGYPIYGPYGYSNPTNTRTPIIRMTSGYALRNPSYRAPTEACDLNVYPMGMFTQDYEFTQDGTLDEHNGRYCITPDYPNGTYAYFATVNNSGPTYPYFIGPTFYGTVSPVNNSLIPGPGIKPLVFDDRVNVVWELYKNQEPSVDFNSMRGMHLIDNVNKNIIVKLDIIDPVKGRILGSAQADIDFTTSLDPAFYNNGTNDSLTIDSEFNWGEQQIGLVWWDLEAVRYYDYEQSTIEYRANNWGKVFPGSNIFIYEWVSSNVLPSMYVTAGSDGIPKYADDSGYSTLYYVDDITMTVKTKYYYWVRAKNSVGKKSKSHSVSGLEQMIADPGKQDIPYAALIDDKTVALYNIGKYLLEDRVALHIDYSLAKNENIVHSEFELFQEGNKNAIMHPRIEKKIIDSLVGVDENKNLVPDPSLLPADRLGVSDRPRQSIIADRLVALDNIIGFINQIILKYPVATRIFDKETVYSDNFYAAEPYPAKSEYDLIVDTFIQLDYLFEIYPTDLVVGTEYIIAQVGNTNFVELGASANQIGVRFKATGTGVGLGTVFHSRILVAKDINNGNRWAIYYKRVGINPSPLLLKIQSYNTTNFWNFIDWYANGYNKNTLVVTKSFDNYNLTYTDTFDIGDIVKINDNGKGKFSIYRYNEKSTLELIAIESGTIEISSKFWNKSGFDHEGMDFLSFDYSYFEELRYIFKGIKEDIFVKDLEIYYNQFLFYVIEYVLSEQKYVDWIFKTSFISVAHELQGLVQLPSYVKDRQALYEQYINEVKPYRTKIREYILKYSNLETLDTNTVTDFDLPSYYDFDLGKFRSPNGEFPGKDEVLLSTKPEYQDWKNHYGYSIGSIEIANAGIGYISNGQVVTPDISIVPTDETGYGANATAVIDERIAGAISSVNIKTPGDFYTTTPLIVVSGVGATQMSQYQAGHPKSALLSPRLLNKKIRKINTVMKFDRVSYDTQVQEWAPNTNYDNGVYVTYQGKCYITNSNIGTLSKFDKTQFASVASDAFNNANDRITAFYNPTASMIPKTLSRLMTGLDRPILSGEQNVIIDTAIQGGGFTGTSIAAGRFILDKDYIIINIGNTDFTLCGASSNRVGLKFTATDVGSGTGSATIALSTSGYGTASGIEPGTITLTGGAFVYETFSHAPEELLPGITFDAVSIRVVDDSGVGYRKFVNMNQIKTVSNTAPQSLTTLSQDLLITDQTITVSDSSKLYTPSRLSISPGLIFVNGELIEYYTKTNNVLGQLRRGVGGTGTPMVHLLGSTVENSNLPGALRL